MTEVTTMPSSKNGHLVSKRGCDKQSSTMVFPPCRVCGGKSSGFHFGVISCEACKVFFRRNSETTFRCKKNDQCLITQCLQTGKAPCPACRWEKCLSVGMSRQNIKKGRLALATRAKTNKEVKEDEEKKRREKEEELNRLEEEEARIEALIQRTVEIERRVQVPPEVIASIADEHNKYMEARKAKEALFGKLKPLPHDVYEEIYTKCGLDVDDRRQRLQECATKCKEDFISYLDFAKSLPEFKTFSMEDRIVLVRENYYDVLIFTFLDVMDPERELLSCVSCGMIYHPDDFETYNDNNYHKFFSCGKILKPLNLSDEERALIKAVALLNAYGCNADVPKDQTKIEKVQEKYLEALQYLLEKNRGRGAASAMVMGKIFSCVTEMKEAFNLFRKNSGCYLDLFPDMECPDIVKEIFQMGCHTTENLVKFLES